MPMNRYALLIGCNQGKDSRTLESAEKDVERIRKLLLRHPVGWDDARITALRGMVTRQQIDDAIQALRAQVAADDFVFVYYAGHGTLCEEETCLVLPRQTYLVRHLTNAFVVHPQMCSALLVLDCCYSEP